MLLKVSVATFRQKKTVFHKNWVDLDLNIDGHIPLALKPLTYANVWKVDLRSLLYIAPRVTSKIDSAHDILQQMTLGVESAAPRIKDCLGHEQGERIIQGLKHEIKLQREDREVPFSWNLSMYKNPPINWNPAVSFVSTSADELSGVRAEAEKLVSMEDAGGVINTTMELANIGDYVIVRPNQRQDSLKRPFWGGQITKNYIKKAELRVHWLLPPTGAYSSRCRKGAKETGGKATCADGTGQEKAAAVSSQLKFVTPASVPAERRHKPQEPNRLCTLRNYPYAQFKPVLDINSSIKSHSNKGVRAVKLNTDVISYNCVFFSFPHLATEDRLPDNVLDAISEHDQIQWKG